MRSNRAEAARFFSLASASLPTDVDRRAPSARGTAQPAVVSGVAAHRSSAVDVVPEACGRPQPSVTLVRLAVVAIRRRAGAAVSVIGASVPARRGGVRALPRRPLA